VYIFISLPQALIFIRTTSTTYKHIYFSASLLCWAHNKESHSYLSAVERRESFLVERHNFVMKEEEEEKTLQASPFVGGTGRSDDE
jgi:hypothetical protein